MLSAALIHACAALLSADLTFVLLVLICLQAVSAVARAPELPICLVASRHCFCALATAALPPVVAVVVLDEELEPQAVSAVAANARMTSTGSQWRRVMSAMMAHRADGGHRVRTTLGHMCRNIHTLHNFDPPATEAEIGAAALQYVRKISGYTKPSQANQAAFDEAVAAVAAASGRLLGQLTTNAEPRNREVEAAKARARAAQRYAAA